MQKQIRDQVSWQQQFRCVLKPVPDLRTMEHQVQGSAEFVFSRAFSVVAVITASCETKLLAKA